MSRINEDWLLLKIRDCANRQKSIVCFNIVSLATISCAETVRPILPISSIVTSALIQLFNCVIHLPSFTVNLISSSHCIHNLHHQDTKWEAQMTHWIISLCCTGYRITLSTRSATFRWLNWCHKSVFDSFNQTITFASRPPAGRPLLHSRWWPAWLSGCIGTSLRRKSQDVIQFVCLYEWAADTMYPREESPRARE